MTAPWHDTVTHACKRGSTGPVVPVSHDPPTPKTAHHVKCAACGDDWIELDAAVMARVWWSAGAWLGKSITENEASLRALPTSIAADAGYDSQTGEP